MSEKTNIVEMKGIVKVFSHVRALKEVDFSVRKGEVHALLGENGAGKSTLIKILTGVYPKDGGEIVFDGKPVDIESREDASKLGIACIFQEFSLIPTLSVTQNILLNKEKNKFGILQKKAMRKEVDELIKRFDFPLNPDDIIETLSVAQKQMVEILKALSTNARLIIMDEPTASLSAKESEMLYKIIHQLREREVSIIYISHRLEEVFALSDRITVLRDGQFIGKVNTSDVTNADIISMMFGETQIRRRPDTLKAQDEIVMDVQGLCRKGKFQDVSFQLHRGEVLGIAGMLGAGRTELLKSLFGADPYDAGSITVNSTQAPHRASPIKMKKLGLGLTPENRKEEGLILIHSIRDNLCYASMDKTSNGWLEIHKKRVAAADKQVGELQIKIPDIEAPVSSLSGGNQQKVVVGNWLNTEPQIMLYDEPSRGIDVNAKQQIFEIMWAQAQQGVSTIFVSSELEELLEVCHRILIMKEGKLIGEVRPEDVNINQLYALCMGDEVNERK